MSVPDQRIPLLLLCLCSFPQCFSILKQLLLWMCCRRRAMLLCLVVLLLLLFCCAQMRTHQDQFLFCRSLSLSLSLLFLLFLLLLSLLLLFLLLLLAMSVWPPSSLGTLLLVFGQEAVGAIVMRVVEAPRFFPLPRLAVTVVLVTAVGALFSSSSCPFSSAPSSSSMERRLGSVASVVCPVLEDWRKGQKRKNKKECSKGVKLCL